MPQRVLSKAIDNAQREQVLQAPGVPMDLRAHLQLTAAAGADAWLNARPCKAEGSHMATELWRVAMARRLRVPLLDDARGCPMCGEALDVFMDHALVCQCGGDRTLRHHAVRDALHSHCCRAGLQAEREKAGLLPPRPPEEGGREGALPQDRRPADVWLQRGPNGRATAVDLAVSSGLGRDALLGSAADGTATCAQYEDRKRGYLDTAAQCEAASLDFEPFVLEAHGGGMGVAARRVLAYVASSAAALEGEDVEERAAVAAGGLSIALMRESARAVVRRLAPPRESAPSACPGGWGEEATTEEPAPQQRFQ